MEDMKIFEAASSNNIEIVRAALAGAYGEQSSEDLELALIRAAGNGHWDCVILLLESKININGTNGNEDTALTLASQNGHVGVVKMLLDHSCAVNHQNSMGYSALMKACENGHIEIVDVLLKHGAVDIPEGIAEEHAGIANGVSKLPKYMPHGYTSLMVTILHQPENYKRILKLLIGANFKINERDLQDMMVLHHAAIKCTDDVVEMLLEAGADVNAKDVWGVTPLMSAVAYGKINSVKILLRYGADVSVVCKAKRTALSIAVRTGSEELIKTVLSASADPNTKDAHGHVPLFIAILHNNYAGIKCMIQAGCDLNVVCRDMTTFQKMTCFRCALQRKNVSMVEMLHQAGACSNKEVYDAFTDENYKQQCAEKPEIFALLNELVATPQSLRSTCRMAVRNSCDKERCWADCVSKLKLPKSLQEYLLYMDINIPVID